MFRQRFFVFSILIFIFVVVAAYLILQKQVTNQESPNISAVEVQSNSGITFRFESRFPTFDIDSSSVDKSLLNTMLETAGFQKNWQDFGIFGGNQRVKPKLVVVSFEPIDEVHPPVVDIIKSGGKTVRGFGSEYDSINNVVRYHISFDPSVFQSRSTQEIAAGWTNSVLRLFFIQAGGDLSSNLTGYDAISQNILGISPNVHSIFTIIERKNISLIDTLTSFKIFLGSVLSPQVYAQTCGGTLSCGFTQATCQCSAGGGCYQDGASCGTTTTTCTWSGGPNNGGGCSFAGQTDGYGGTCNCRQTGGGTCSCSGVECMDGPRSCQRGNQCPGPNPCGVGACTGVNSCGWSATCTQNAWSACSKPCGGGIQSETDSCGVVHTQACNIAACAPVCGDGVCNGTETCSTCASDCGACSGGYCGDGSCNNGENCGTCSQDCGSCSGGCTCTAPMCGQCGGSCPNTSGTAPAAPDVATFVPANNSQVLASGNQVAFSWGPVAGATLYDVEVFPTSVLPANINCATNSACQLASASTTFTTILPGNSQSYNWRVRATNATCPTSASSAWTQATFNITSGTITGGFYIDRAGAATLVGQFCQLNGAAALPAGQVTRVRAQGGQPTQNIDAVITNANYTVSGMPADPNTQLTLQLPGNSTWRCVCPSSCQYSGFSEPQAGVNFYFSDQANGWWQSSNSLLYAQASSGTAIQSLIPTTCVPASSCTPLLSLPDTGGTLPSQGYALTGGGDIISSATTTTPYINLRKDPAPATTNAHLIGDKHSGPVENFAFFSQLYSLGSNPTDDRLAGNAAPKPAVNPPTHQGAYYNGSSLTINSDWTLGATDNIVIFVNGDLNVNANVTVPSGAFLAFIVSGNIHIGPTVGTTTLTQTTPAQVQGVYIANGLFTVDGIVNRKFIGAGTFVGWGGVQLNRQYLTGSNNATAPTELFLNRPDLMINTPLRMKRPLLLWQETN